MWVGRATVFAVGLVVILALLFALANMVFGTGGKLSIVGESDQTGGITQLVGSEAGAERVLDVDPVAKRQPQQGYAHVNIEDGNPDTPAFDPARSKGVNDVKIIPGSPYRYCFDLTFTPKVVVGSPFISNNATVATATPPDPFVSDCPEGYRDAAVNTYAANTSTGTPVGFKIMFR
jgi:hypothetical protein